MSTTGTPVSGSTSSTASGTNASGGGSPDVNTMAAMIFPHLQNRSTDPNYVARAVQIALLIKDESGKQEKQKAKDDEAKAKLAAEGQAAAKGGILTLLKDNDVVEGLAPGATPDKMKAALDKLRAAGEAAQKDQGSSESQSGAGSGASQGAKPPQPTHR